MTFLCHHPQLDFLASEELARSLQASASDDGQPYRRLADDFIFGLVYYSLPVAMTHFIFGKGSEAQGVN